MARHGLMPLEQPCRAALELHEANPLIPAYRFQEFIGSCRVWWFDWGLIFANRNDMHIHVYKSHRKHVLFRKELKKVAEIFNEFPVLKTSVMKDKPNSLDFNLRLGWKLVSETDDRWNLEMTEKDFKNVWK